MFSQPHCSSISSDLKISLLLTRVSLWKDCSISANSCRKKASSLQIYSFMLMFSNFFVSVHNTCEHVNNDKGPICCLSLKTMWLQTDFISNQQSVFTSETFKQQNIQFSKNCGASQLCSQIFLTQEKNLAYSMWNDWRKYNNSVIIKYWFQTYSAPFLCPGVSCLPL